VFTADTVFPDPQNHTHNHSKIHKQTNKKPFYDPLIQDNPGELVLSQRRGLLEQPLDFHDPDVLPATQAVMSKHYRKTQWFGRLLFSRHGKSTNQQCQSTEGN